MIKKPEKVLLLGGSGYLGSHIANRFKKEGDFIVTIGDLIKPLNSELEFVEVDVLNRTLASSVIKEHDLIINCTGQITNPINTCFRINTKGVGNIIEAVQTNKKKLYHVSTIAVYGTAEYADENSGVNPESPYAACKSFAEYQINNDLTKKMFCILRPSNLYGENQTKGLFAYIFNSYLSDRKLHFNNNGTLSRYFIHITDCADAIYLAVRKDLRGTFNITSDDKYDLKKIISLVENNADISFEKKFDQIKPIENIDILNFRSFNELTGFSPKFSLSKFINKAFSIYA